jgi:SAM-dependent methyltransferase
MPAPPPLQRNPPPQPAVSRPLWRDIASRSRDALYRVASIVDRVVRLGETAVLPPLHLRVYYYRTSDPAAYSRACEAARTELLLRGLRPEHRVLDIGCGIGNLALGLAGYLTGEYHGFDIRRDAIVWCQREITPRHPQFHFHHADLASVAYNARGRQDAAAFRFPLPDASVDYVFLGSVFTHLMPDAVEHYLREIGRMLSPGGVCIASCFLLNDATRANAATGKGFMTFAVEHPSGLCRLHDAARPEAAVALEEAFVTRAHGDAGLRITDVRRGGWWHGGRHDQDVVTSERLSQGQAWHPNP